MFLQQGSILGLLLAFSTGLASGSEAISNWPAPASWAPGRTAGAHTMADVTNPLPFIGVAPCRVADTRGNGFTGAYGPPSLVHDTNRTFVITGQCGIPASAAAVSFNFAALNVGGAGDLRVFPAGGGLPLVSTMNYNASTPNIANAAIVPLGTGGGITVRADAVAVDLIIDVNGYYGSTPATSTDYFKVVNSGPYAIYGETSSTEFAASGILGLASATTGTTIGVWGDNKSSDNAIGVLGTTDATSGVTVGVWGRTLSHTAGTVGAYGEATGTTSAATYGVKGFTTSTAIDSAGVLGVDGSGDPRPLGTFTVSAGVVGASTTGLGVLGASKGFGTGVIGVHVNGSGGWETAGHLGASAPDGVFALGNVGATGMKTFIEPHPTDATKEIAYVSLEGPEAGTYFRGRGRIHNGVGTISVPESFRIVSDEEGLTVQITPIGQVANVAVLSADLSSVVVRSSVKDLEFYYVVNGVRKAFKDWKEITENRHYVPQGPGARMPGVFAPEQRRALIATGIYNEDGTVNMETAERLGWAKAWADREAQSQALARETQKASAQKEK